MSGWECIGMHRRCIDTYEDPNPRPLRWQDFRPVVHYFKNLTVFGGAVGLTVWACAETFGGACPAAFKLFGPIAIGALLNFGGEEAIDCAYGDCLSFSWQEASGDLVEGAFLGGSSGILAQATARALGMTQDFAGLWSVMTNPDYGPRVALTTAVSQYVERTIRGFGSFILNALQP